MCVWEVWRKDSKEIISKHFHLNYFTKISMRNSTPRYISKRTDNIYSHKNLHMNVHSSIISNRQKVGTTQMSINWWTDTLWSIGLLEYQSSIKMKHWHMPYIAWMILENIMLSGEVWQQFTYLMIPFILSI